jgi:hypothetical protein
MGRRIVKISPSLLQDMFTVGGGTSATEVVNGLPVGARFVRAWYEGSEYPEGVLVLLFEHESWLANEGGLYQVVDVQMRRVD